MNADSPAASFYQLWRAYRLRWKRRYFLARAIRRRRHLTTLTNRTSQIKRGDILCFSCVRNEMERIEYFLKHHRGLGVAHFLFVDNGSDDGTHEHLAAQSDCSVWSTTHSYKASRFGVDWTTWLQFRYGHGHWCLTLDADELFLPPYEDQAKLPDLVTWLDQHAAPAMSATMLDLYPKGPISDQDFDPQDPLSLLNWFDPGGIESFPRGELQGTLKRGGVRGRVFFADAPEKAPTLSKLPLVKWNRRFAYLTSTHVILPPRLNAATRSGEAKIPQAVILHTKFLPTIAAKAQQEKHRKQHFSNSAQYDAYYDALASGPDLWNDASVRLHDWSQLEQLGLMTRGDWRL